ncbi:unnamed protein product, partial [Hapterophycus canaliculatus]
SLRGAGAEGASASAGEETGNRDSTLEEDLALFHRMHQENEGLLAVRKRLRTDVVTLQDEEDKLRRVLGLPPARSELAPPAPAPLPPLPEPLVEQVKTNSKRGIKKRSRTTTPPSSAAPSLPPQPAVPGVSTVPTAASPRVQHPTVPSFPTLPTAVRQHAPSPLSRSPSERRPDVERSSGEIVAASTIPGSASTPARGDCGGGNEVADAPTRSPCSPPVPGSPVGSFDLASGENDDIEKLLLGLDDTPTAGDDSDNAAVPQPPSPMPREHAVGAEPRPTAGRGRGRSGRARADGALGQKQARGRGRGPVCGDPRGRGGNGLGGAGRGVKKKPNYLDLNATVKHRPAGRGGGRASARGRIGSRGGGLGGGRGASALGAG